MPCKLLCNAAQRNATQYNTTNTSFISNIRPNNITPTIVPNIEMVGKGMSHRGRERGTEGEIDGEPKEIRGGGGRGRETERRDHLGE